MVRDEMAWLRGRNTVKIQGNIIECQCQVRLFGVSTGGTYRRSFWSRCDERALVKWKWIRLIRAAVCTPYVSGGLCQPQSRPHPSGHCAVAACSDLPFSCPLNQSAHPSRFTYGGGTYNCDCMTVDCNLHSPAAPNPNCH